MKTKLILFFSLLFLVVTWLKGADTRPRLIFCDVGQGDAILFSQKNIQILFDAGPPNKKVLNCLQNHMALLDKTIEVLIVTHADNDHSGGIADVLKSYKIKKIFANQEIKSLIEQNYYSTKLHKNDVISISQINFEVENPEENYNIKNDDNSTSIAGVLNYKDKRILLLGDIDSEIERKLVWRKMVKKPIDVIKVSHHGSNEATSNEILDELKPSVAIISVGKNNKFGHPNKEVLERLENHNIEIRRTDKEGDLVFELD
jgi:beta-lactamase superfamily II metal-dependent hydrolase